MAIDYRIRYSFALTPSHNLVAWLGAWKLLGSADRVKMNAFLQQRAGYTVGPIENDRDAPTARSQYSFDVIYSFFRSLEALLERVQPVGRSLQAEEERELCRYCFLLGLLEEPFRSSRYKDGPLMVPAPRHTLEELLAPFKREAAKLQFRPLLDLVNSKLNPRLDFVEAYSLASAGAQLHGTSQRHRR